MAVRRKNQSAYGFGQSLYDLSPKPIIAQRAPTATDFAEVGTLWCDQAAVAMYTLVKVSNGAADWVVTGGGGATFNNLQVNPGPTDITGDVTVTSAAASTIDMASGTGGITLTTTGDYELDSGGAVTIDADAKISISSSQAAADSVDIQSTNATGSINILAANSTAVAGITLETDAASGINIHAVGDAGKDIQIINDNGSITIEGGEPGVPTAVRIDSTGPASGIRISTLNNSATILIATGTAAKTVQLGSNSAGSTVRINTPGTAGISLNNGTVAASLFIGAGDPNGSVNGVNGSLYLNTGGTNADQKLWVCTTNGLNNWTALTST